MPFNQFQHGKRNPSDPLGHAENLPDDLTLFTDNGPGKSDAFALQPALGRFNIFRQQGDMMQGPVTECIHPVRDDTGPAPFILVGLIDEQSRKSRSPVHLRIPIPVFQGLGIDVPEPDEFPGAPVDVSGPEGNMIDQGLEPDPGGIKKGFGDQRRTVL